MDSVKIAADDGVGAIIETFGAQLTDAAKPMSLVIQFDVRDADQKKVEAAFARARPRTLQEAGCRAFDLNREAGRPNHFVVYESWRSLHDLDAHLRTGYITQLRTELNELIAGGPDFRVLATCTDFAGDETT